MVQADGLLRNVSIDRITKKSTTASASSPQPSRQPSIATPTNSHSASNNRAVVADPHPPSMEEVGTSAPPAYDIPETANQPEDHDTTEYVIDKLLSHSDTVEGRFFKVRWYGYRPQADEWLPERDTPENIVALYWRSVRLKAAQTRPFLERGEEKSRILNTFDANFGKNCGEMLRYRSMVKLFALCSGVNPCMMMHGCTVDPSTCTR